MLERQTTHLDERHPELLEVRQALLAKQRQMLMRSNTVIDLAASGKGSSAGEAARENCLVLDEKAIEYCGTCCADVLAAVSNSCRSVVACRARKDQKAQMLNLIKANVPASTCLAIGDGANDVAMIKAGHIGVGIIGKEGMQAVNNSDFAVGPSRDSSHACVVSLHHCVSLVGCRLNHPPARPGGGDAP